MRVLDLPPVWLAAHLMAAWVLAQDAPVYFWGDSPFRWVGLAFIADGVILMGWAALSMARAQTPIIPRREPQQLVTSGPFRFSRNPIYLADVLILLGFIILIGAASALVLVPLFLWIITVRFIRGEEAALRERFSDAFEAWATKTRRWI